MVEVFVQYLSETFFVVVKNKSNSQQMTKLHDLLCNKFLKYSIKKMTKEYLMLQKKQS